MVVVVAIALLAGMGQEGRHLAFQTQRLSTAEALVVAAQTSQRVAGVEAIRYMELAAMVVMALPMPMQQMALLGKDMALAVEVVAVATLLTA
jgi:hypothetical protein